MANDYYFNFTDPSKPAFVVKPYTVNGYETPDSVPTPAFFTTGDTIAVSANTSLVFVGKGMPEYGDAVQNNFVYLLENFANSNPPINPTEGQIWYKNVDLVDGVNPSTKGAYIHNGTSWDKLLIETASGMTADLDMGGFNVINVGGTGSGYDAATELYVNTTMLTHAVDDTLHLTVSQNALLDGISGTITPAEINYLDGVTSTIQPQLDGKLPLAGGVLTGALTLNADPTNALHAATKQYVDAYISASSDGVVNAGSLNSVTGVLTLGRTVGPPVVVSGDFAPWIHMQEDLTVTHDVTLPVNQSFLYDKATSEGTYPTPSVYDALKYLDQATYHAQRPIRRQLIESTGAGFTPLNLNSNLLYTVGSNRLQVYVNGVKNYASERGHSTIVYYSPDALGLASDTGLAPSSVYTADITVDAAPPVTITINTSTIAYTFSQLLYEVNAQLAMLSIPAVATIEQFLNRLEFTITSNTAGVGSAVAISFVGGELFESIVSDSVASPTDVAVTTDYAYEEVGTFGVLSGSLMFNSVPVAGSVVEILLLP